MLNLPSSLLNTDDTVIIELRIWSYFTHEQWKRVPEKIRLSLVTGRGLVENTVNGVRLTNNGWHHANMLISEKWVIEELERRANHV